MTKVLYKPVGMLVSVLGGVLAGAIFKQVWKVAFSEDDAPKATDTDRSWREVLLAAALQGAIFGLVKAAVDRGAAEGTRKVTRRRTLPGSLQIIPVKVWNFQAESAAHWRRGRGKRAPAKQLTRGWKRNPSAAIRMMRQGVRAHGHFASGAR
jgi:hypothetical protein